MSSYLAVATARYEDVVRFYRDGLGFPVIRAWDRPNGRGALLDVGGMRLEVLDALREPRPLNLPAPGDRIHLVVEVPDVDAVHRSLRLPAPIPQTRSWGARMFELRDPDGLAVAFVQWLDEPD